MYTIKKILFASRGLVGRGTVCYLASWKEEDYIIKDHWVLGKRDNVILNEIEMLKEMQGVPGVPELVEYWLVATSDGDVDNTRSYRRREHRSIKGTSRTHVRLVLKPCARPLHMFRTLKELVKALRDIVMSKCLVELCKSIELISLLLVQKTAVEERGILHRDSSLNNAMILDCLDTSMGFLINWEFAVRITKDNQYTIGGTVSTFLSYRVQILIHFPGHDPFHVTQASPRDFGGAGKSRDGSQGQAEGKCREEAAEKILEFFGTACLSCDPRLL
jgi:hypothetical protein